MMKGGMGNLMRQAQQMQENMKRVQDEIARMEISGEAGAGKGRAGEQTHGYGVKRAWR